MEVLKYLNEKYELLQDKESCISALQEDLGIKPTYNYKYGLVVLNYSQIDSPKTNPIVIECRSLVLGLDDNEVFYIVSRSFDRFLNLGENGNEDKIDITTMTAYEKLDGSLIGLFFHRGEWLYRTKSMIMPDIEMFADAFGNSWKDLIDGTLGDFVSVKHNPYSKEYTFILEVTSPINRIVTRYEDSKITLLSVRHNLTGEYLAQVDMVRTAEMNDWGYPSSFKFGSIAQCKEAVADLPNLQEGYVLYDMDGVPKCKIKSPLYLAVHRIRGESVPTPKRIMDLVFTNETDEYLTYFSEDTYMFQPYMDAFILAEQDFNISWDRVSNITDQKEFALTIKGTPTMHLMFRKKQNNSLTFSDCFSNLTSQAKYNLTERYLK